MKKIRVALFDDNLFFRKSIHIMMEGREDIELVKTYKNANNLVKHIHISEPDLVLMDIDMPGTNGIDAVKILRKVFPKLPVMMLTDFDEEEKIIASICAGADGYSLKTMTSQKIIESIHDVFQGHGSLSAPIARIVLDLFSEKFSDSVKGDSFRLTARQKDVLKLLVQGKQYKIISGELNISYDTVRAHIKHIYKKLQVSTIAGAVAKAMKYNMAMAS